MTKQQKTNVVAFVTVVPTVGALAFWLLSTAFVPHRAYNQDQRRQDLATDSLRSQSHTFRADMEQLKRIGCVPLTREQKDIAGCP